MPVIIELECSPRPYLGTIDRRSPALFDLDITDVLHRTPCTVFSLGPGQTSLVSLRGGAPLYTTLTINDRTVDDPIHGYLDFAAVPSQNIESVAMHHDVLDEGIHVRTKTNRYNRPYSVVRYATGSYGTNLYHFDFSRPVTNYSGLLAGGSQFASDGYENSGGSDVVSLYGNAYSNRAIPGRLDIVYLDGTADLPVAQETTDARERHNALFDASAAVGNAHHTIALFYNLRNSDYSDSLQAVLYKHSLRSYGIGTRHCYRFIDLEIANRFGGTFRQVESTVYGSHRPHSLDAGMTVTRPFRDFSASAIARGTIDAEGQAHTAFRCEGTVRLLDSTLIYAAMGRDFRQPSIAECSMPHIETYWLHGDTTLTTAYRTVQECGFASDRLSCAVYRYGYDRFVYWTRDDSGTFVPHVLTDWQTIGLEGQGAVDIYLAGSSGDDSFTTIELSAWGNHLLSGDSLPLLPKTRAGFQMAVRRHTERFGAYGVCTGSVTGDRAGWNDSMIASHELISAAATVRFVTLSFTLRVNNLLDAHYDIIPGHAAPGRNLMLFIDWEFWD